MAERKRAAKPRTAKAAATAVSIDPAAPGLVLAYQGGRTGRFVPHRDLEGVDVARIAYRRAVAHHVKTLSRKVFPGQERAPATRPNHATAKELADLVAELVASGAFVRVMQQPEA